jgi:hypothetical protein
MTEVLSFEAIAGIQEVFVLQTNKRKKSGSPIKLGMTVVVPSGMTVVVLLRMTVGVLSGMTEKIKNLEIFQKM